MSMLRPDIAAPDDKSSVDGTLPVHQTTSADAESSKAEKSELKNNDSHEIGASRKRDDAPKRGLLPWSKRPGTSASTDSSSSTDEKKKAGQDVGTIAVAKDVHLPPVGFTELFR